MGSPIKKALWLIGFAAACVLMWGGAEAGETMRTMMNAVMLCLSCVGIG